ncbi:hypothetical protein O5D80_003347 [Batrachochytrium dendrobatidis]|nr:hypothetical protein O5D80_003347 [Batrachochytrium dendrobatidis]
MNTESSPTEVTIVQDKLKTVVQATAEHLMDISSIRMLDRLENNYAVQRSAEYRRALENAPQDDIVKELRLKRHPQTLIQLNPSTLIAPITTSSGHSISIHSLPSTTSVEQNEIDQFADYCSKISLALNNLKAKDTEVLIVPIS